MKKLAILIDSFCGLRKEEVEKMGIEFISQIFILDGKYYKEGSDGILTDFADKIASAKDAKTSLPAIGLVIGKMEKLSKEYENVIFLPVNKGLSSTFSITFAAAKEYENVHVINTRFAGSAIIYQVKKALKMSEEGAHINEVKDFILEASSKSKCWVLPKDVKQLIKGGRLNGVKKIIFERTKLIPSLYLTDNGFQVKGVRRNFYKIICSAIIKTKEKIERDGNEEYIWEIIHTTYQKTLDLVKKAFKENGIINYKISLASCATVCHSGVGAVGVNAYLK